jgi:D-alanyl-D-alanine carboxypeptidase (penicillin-binding protein 5/6)
MRRHLRGGAALPAALAILAMAAFLSAAAKPASNRPPARARLASHLRGGLDRGHVQGPPLAYGDSWLEAHPSPDLGLGAQSAIVVDLGTREVLWARDPDSRRAPASLTKMVTAMVAADHASLDRPLQVPAGATDFGPDYTTMGLAPGEWFSLADLVQGMFATSGNDAAETLARDLVPRDQFVAEMNELVGKLGLTDTHFENPTGVDAPGQYSTAHDLAVIAGWLLTRYPALAALAARPELHLPPTDSRPAFDAVSLDKLLWLYPGATGLKTGYTDAAGGCLAGSATRAGRRLVEVDLGSDELFTDGMRLLDYGFQAAE